MSQTRSFSVVIALVVYKQVVTETLAYQSLLKTIKAGTDNFLLRYELFIYDNSPDPMKIIPDQLPVNYSYKSNTKNPGVGKAYNEAFLRAKELNYEWVLLLDQDSIIDETGLLKYFDSITQYPQVKIHAPILRAGNITISPSRYRFGRGFAADDVKKGINRLGALVPLNSGMCVHNSVFEITNGYNEDIKLDFSDFDFIRRASEKIDQFAVIDLVLIHELSSINETRESAIIRYKFYCNGAKRSILSQTDVLKFGIVAFLRGGKLIYKFRDVSFLGIFLRYFLGNKVV